MRSLRTRAATTVGLAALSLSSLYIGTADAARIISRRLTCGQTITTSTRLLGSVGPCNGPGVIVGADNITLDLRGYWVFGNYDEGVGGEHPGILLANRTGVTIIGNGGSGRGEGTGEGTVEGFEAGVLIGGGSGNTIQGLTIQDNVGPSDLEAALLGDGIGVFNSPSNIIQMNIIQRNGHFDGIGVLGFGSDRNAIQNNTVAGTTGADLNGVGIVLNSVLEFPSPTPGASIFDNQVTGNLVRNNTNGGISNVSAVNSLIRGNTVEDNGRDFATPGNGIGLSQNGLAQPVTNVRVEDNISRGNTRGLQLASSGNTVVNNNLSDNQAGGLQLTRLAVNSNAADDNTVSNNQINNNGSYGVNLFLGARNTLADNLVNDNGAVFGTGGMFIAGDPSMNNSNVILRNEVRHNFGRRGGIWLTTENNQILNNNAADNFGFDGSDNRDLFDSHEDCDANVWFGNIWGSGGFAPDCVTAGGSGPNPPIASAATQSRAASAEDAGALSAEEPPPPAATGRHARPRF